MTPEKLKEAEFEAKRFLKRLAELKKVKDDAQHYWQCPKEYGAIRRASMDLTRALASLRSYK